ncbi:MAG: hypothetical protein A2V98_01755 [Planctomycetes bacterium RBG_16_64_12]|nr:MAG: hypothetical protein A2V98_01755 [Planctomycetes bacterium RBG_16_64_12]
MITAATLKTRTTKDLAAMAKRKRIPGWHSMRKDELIKALVKLAKSERVKANRGKSSTNGKVRGKTARAKNNGNEGRNSPSGKRARKAKPPRCEKRLDQIKAKLSRFKDLARDSNGDDHIKDRLVVMVRDPYWLHAYWELKRRTVERARVAMGQRWHAARPILRLSEVARDGTTSTVRKVLRDIQIHGGVNNWYVDVDDPPKTFQLDLGYLGPDGKFLCLVRSNVVTTPQSGPAGACDGNWAEIARDFDRIYALSGGYADPSQDSDLKDLFEERLRRPMGSPMVTRFGRGAQAVGQNRPEFPFAVDAEMIVYGLTDPNAHVTLRGEPVRVQSDGSFTVRFNLPNRRQVLPVVASSGDGVEQRTIVLAVERNTKEMEPVIREPNT